jgi:predicted outer membrane repeat protein
MLADSHITGNADGGMSLGSLMTGTIERCLFEGNGGPSADLGGLRVSSGAEIQLADSTFKDNAAWVQGGGLDLYVNQDDGRLRRISRCTFEGNSAGHGGGLAVQGGFDFEPDGCGAPEVLIDECVFLGNTANIGHGGGMVIHWACPQIVNSTFLGNSADKGGAIAIPNTTNDNFESEESSPFIVNTLIAGNTADQGGGIFLLGAHKPYLLNCTLAHNTATVDGGGLWVSSQNIVGFAAPRIVNSLLWGNVDAGGADESAQFHNAGQAAAIINYTLLQGSSGGGVATHGADPLFTDPDGADDVYGTRDDDLTVQAGSPAIDSGNNEPYLVPWAVTDVADLDCDGDFAEPVALDRARVRRFVDDPAVADTGFGAAPMIDRGAYERGAWRHLGSELAGTHGKPCLVGDGNLVSGSTTGLALSNTLEFATSGLFLGLSAANFAPFFGGTLVPSPDILILIPTGATGGWTAAGAFPAGVPAGFTFWAHVWVEDPAAAFGLAGSNAVSATSP